MVVPYLIASLRLARDFAQIASTPQLYSWHWLRVEGRGDRLGGKASPGRAAAGRFACLNSRFPRSIPGNVFYQQ